MKAAPTNAQLEAACMSIPPYRIARMMCAQIAADERRFRGPSPRHEDKLSGVGRKRSALCQHFGHVSQVYSTVLAVRMRQSATDRFVLGARRTLMMSPLRALMNF